MSCPHGAGLDHLIAPVTLEKGQLQESLIKVCVVCVCTFVCVRVCCVCMCCVCVCVCVYMCVCVYTLMSSLLIQHQSRFEPLHMKTMSVLETAQRSEDWDVTYQGRAFERRFAQRGVLVLLFIEIGSAASPSLTLPHSPSHPPSLSITPSLSTHGLHLHTEHILLSLIDSATTCNAYQGAI